MKKDLKDDDKDLETAFKVVSIMQTVTEELDETGKRAWRKMLGLDEKKEKQVTNVTKD